MTKQNVYPYNGLFGHKREEVLILDTILLNLKSMLTKISEIQKATLYDCIYIKCLDQANP
jgi:hypothetical protein